MQYTKISLVYVKNTENIETNIETKSQLIQHAKEFNIYILTLGQTEYKYCLTKSVRDEFVTTITLYALFTIRQRGVEPWNLLNDANSWTFIDHNKALLIGLLQYLLSVWIM